MAKNIYVGNLPWSVDDSALREMFEEHGDVQKAQVIKDRHTGKSRGFGFVEMSDDAAADQAIDSLNGADCQGRPLTVNEARQREQGGYRNGGGRGGYSGGNRGRY